MEMDESINVFGEALVGCGGDPVTVFFVIINAIPRLKMLALIPSVLKQASSF